ncbi:MAG: ornithine cyclodeaminase [Chloroflexota bacterium]|jgi:ornithine cyclodeaminase/alanine dehydrogenase-like protein (mu-crystallin family)|nr:ornithine cyclodeaminase [Chloroflexota bacterium]
MLVLTRNDVRQLVPMTDAIELMKLAFRELSAGRAESPLRSVVPVAEGAVTLLMPAYVPAANALGFKVVSVFEGNRDKDLPTISAMVCLLDESTGAPMAIISGAYLTALRTGAVSGAATDLLARDDARNLVVIGAGAQGVTQAAAVAAVRPIEKITVVDLSEDSLERYRGQIAEDWPELLDRLETSSDASVVAQADVICTATTSRKPVFSDRDVKPGTHINAIGAFTPEMQELPEETVARATIVVDQVEAVLEEAGDFIIPINKGTLERRRIERELGQIVAEEAPGRTTVDEITLFKSVGNAVQDVTVARWAVERAIDTGAGQQVSID